MKTISIAKDFSVYPGGRTPDDGPNNGEKFRNLFLAPIFETNEKVKIDFDDVRGYGSSFLEEAFGGLVRIGIPKERIFAQLQLCASRVSHFCIFFSWHSRCRVALLPVEP